MAVVTASYAPDLDVFRRLHASVLQFTPSTTVHHVVVPEGDRQLFAQFEGPRCLVRTAADILPRTVVNLRVVNGWMNLRRPAPVIRGWVMQQALKLAVTAELSVGTVLLADSDVVLLGPTDEESFRSDLGLRFFRQAGAVHAGMPRHARWHQVSREMLGLPPADLPLPDYVSAFNVWSPDVVRSMFERIEQVTGKSWLTAFCSQWHVSEFILYGVFVDEVLGTSAPVDGQTSMFCHSYWEEVPLDDTSAQAFVASVRPQDLALMISAKSRTPLDVRDRATASATSAHGGRSAPGGPDLSGR